MQTKISLWHHPWAEITSNEGPGHDQVKKGPSSANPPTKKKQNAASTQMKMPPELQYTPIDDML